MKILQIISHYQPAVSFGGPLQVAHELAKALIHDGHKVTVCTTNMKDHAQNLMVPLNTTVVLDDIEVIYLPIGRPRYWGFSWALIRRVFHETRNADVIITHFHYQFASIVGAWCARVYKKPYIVFSHGSLNQYAIESKHRILKKLYLNFFEKKNFASALFVAYQSIQELNQSYHFSKRRLVIPIGMQQDFKKNHLHREQLEEKYPQSKNKFIFVYLGRLAEGKGIELLLEAISQLLKFKKQVFLLVIGADERNFLKTLQYKIGALKEHVLFLGLQTGEAKWNLLASADAFVLPSRSEGTSIVTLEAMSVGLPVIVTDRVGLAADVKKYHCGLVISYTQNDLVKAMNEFTERPDLTCLGLNGMSVVRKKYNWQKISKQFVEKIEYYKDIV